MWMNALCIFTHLRHSRSGQTKRCLPTMHWVWSRTLDTLKSSFFTSCWYASPRDIVALHWHHSQSGGVIGTSSTYLACCFRSSIMGREVPGQWPESYVCTTRFIQKSGSLFTRITDKFTPYLSRQLWFVDIWLRTPTMQRIYVLLGDKLKSE